MPSKELEPYERDIFKLLKEMRPYEHMSIHADKSGRPGIFYITIERKYIVSDAGTSEVK